MWNSNKLPIYSVFVFIIAAFAISVPAQKKQRLGLEEGANSVSVEGTITGKQYALFEIRVEKGDVWDVKLSSANNFIGYSVTAPGGDKYDFLEAAPKTGIYVIRVDLNAAGAKSKKPAKFTLEVSFEMDAGKPIS